MTSAKGRHERAIAIHKALPVNEDGTTKIVEIVFHSPPEVILKLGLFFDGTKNNAANTTHRKNYQLQLLNNEKAQTDLPVHDLSYENEYTNIHKLYEMYYFDEELSLTPREDGHIYYQESIYIDGVGTRDGASDDDYSSATGWLGPGISRKTLRAIDEIKRTIEDFKKENKGIRIKEIQYDIFGFSRGAATARFFTNLVRDPNLIVKFDSLEVAMVSAPFSRCNPLTLMLHTGLLEDVKAGLWKNHPNGNVNFLGLFDTVAALCNYTNGMAPGEGDYLGFPILLKENCVEHGIQIQAQHEYRENFSLDDVPPSFTKIILPGSHSDIGGGYLNYPHQEKHCIAKVRRFCNRRSLPSYDDIKKNAVMELKEHLISIRSHPEMKYVFSHLNEKHIETWDNSKINPDVKWRLFQGALVSCRMIKPGLDRIALRVMYNEAISKGCRFSKFLDKNDIPVELTPLAKNIIDFAKTGMSYELTEEEKEFVSQYIHCSVNFERKEIEILKEIPVLDETDQTMRTIKWEVKEPEDKSNFDNIVQPHVPRCDGQGYWFRRINPNRE